MKKLIALTLLCLPLVCQGGIKRGKNVKHTVVNPSAVERAVTTQARRIPIMQEFRTYVLRAMNNTRKYLPKGRREFPLKRYVPTVLKALEERKPVDNKLLATKALASPLALPHVSPYISEGEFWELIMHDIETHNGKFALKYRVKGTPYVGMLRPFLLRDFQGRHFIVPAGSEIPLGSIIDSSGYWIKHEENLARLNNTPRDLKKVADIRQRISSSSLGKNVFLTSQEFKELLFTEQANDFFGPAVLIKDINGVVEVAMPTKIAMAIETPLGVKPVKPFTWVTIEMRDVDRLENAELNGELAQVAAASPIPLHNIEVRHVDNIQEHAFTAREAATYALDPEASLFSVNVLDGGQTKIYTPRQRILFQDFVGELHVLSTESQLIYDGDLKALFLRNETMPEDRASYADFKASVLKDVRDYSVNVNELPNDMPIVLTTRE